jgi:hypothetical protein
MARRKDAARHILTGKGGVEPLARITEPPEPVKHAILRLGPGDERYDKLVTFARLVAGLSKHPGKIMQIINDAEAAGQIHKSAVSELFHLLEEPFRGAARG